MFSKADVDDRIRDHQRYHFECRCVACAEEWPTLPEIETRVAGLRPEAYRAEAGPVDSKKLKRFARLADKALRPTKVGMNWRENVPQIWILSGQNSGFRGLRKHIFSSHFSLFWPYFSIF